MNPSPTVVFLLIVATAGFVAGCATRPIREESQARDRVAELERIRASLAVPELHSESGIEDYLRFALLENPRVQAAHAGWRAAVEDITPARSLPDPKLTFEADIADMLMTLMPGLMFDFMGPGKRAAMGREAAARSEIAYQEYRSAVLKVAVELKKTWADLAYLDTALVLRADALAALDRSLAFARADYAVGKGMGTLEDQVKARTDTERLKLEIVNLNDQRAATRAKFKAALGLAREDADPAWPTVFHPSSAPADEDTLWARLLEANPDIESMRTMVKMAVAEVDLSRKSRVPDFALGGMTDLKASPRMIRPQAELTLPIWRDKIAATIAASEWRHETAEARLSAERIEMAAELAQMTYMVREADRMIAFIDGNALPGIEQSLQSARAGYQSGMVSLAAIPTMELMALDMRLERAAAVREREQVLAELSLLVVGQSPDGAPLLPGNNSR